ncbi:MAG: hypothetical protein JRD89_11685 [Deltaproteobacteria bacterium]|nr:hypothetical protein [Deltaproteobacteria bacterium]
MPTTVKIPDKVAREIDETIVGHYGYRTRSQFVLWCIQEGLKKIRKDNEVDAWRRR